MISLCESTTFNISVQKKASFWKSGVYPPPPSQYISLKACIYFTYSESWIRVGSESDTKDILNWNSTKDIFKTDRALLEAILVEDSFTFKKAHYLFEGFCAPFIFRKCFLYICKDWESQETKNYCPSHFEMKY